MTDRKIIIFVTSYCPACKRMKRDFADPLIAKVGTYKVALLDAVLSRNKAISAKVDKVPTILFFEGNSEAYRAHGAISADVSAAERWLNGETENPRDDPD